MARLWEIKHPYYCNEGNYFSNESCESSYGSWQEFKDSEGDADFDYNLVFRWDWDEENDNGESTFNGDENYRNAKLKIFWMGQRKGLYRWSVIDVCRADESEVRAWLYERWEHLKKLWEPLS